MKHHWGWSLGFYGHAPLLSWFLLPSERYERNKFPIPVTHELPVTMSSFSSMMCCMPSNWVKRHLSPLNCFLSSIWSCQPEKSTNTGKHSVPLCCVQQGLWVRSELWIVREYNTAPNPYKLMFTIPTEDRHWLTGELFPLGVGDWVSPCWEIMVPSAFCLTFWAIANQRCAILSQRR